MGSPIKNPLARRAALRTAPARDTRRRRLRLEGLEDRWVPTLLLSLQEAGVNGGNPTVVATAADFTAVSFNGTYGDFKVTLFGGSSDNDAGLSDLLSSTVSVQNLGGSTATLKLIVFQDNYTQPAGTPLAVESGLGGSLVVGTTVGLEGIFQAYASSANSATFDFTNGPQTAVQTGTTFDTGSATGSFSRVGGAPFALSSTATLALNAGGKVNYSSHVRVPAPPPAAIGDFVWDDTNGNGVQDAGEPGIPNVTVNLLNTSNVVVGTTTTDPNGLYLFPSLTPGTYTVQFVAPAGYTATPKDRGANDAVDSDADTTGKTSTYTLASGESNLTVDAGFYRPVTIGDFVWDDTNANGVQDAGEPGIPGVTLTLFGTDGAGNPVSANTATNGSGFYQFGNLPPGTYTVSVSTPAGYLPTLTGQGTAATDSNPSPSGTTPGFLASGGTDSSIDFGFYLSRPGVQVIKYVNGDDADYPTGPHVGVGSTVTFTYVVTNTGNVPLSNVAVADDVLGAITSFTGDTNSNGLLDLTETWTYTTSAIAGPGQHLNIGTVTGNDAFTNAAVTDSNPANYYGASPSLAIVKLTNGTDNDTGTGPFVPVGSTVTWTYNVTNTGNVALSNVLVTDDNGTPGNPVDDFTVGTIPSLAAGASALLTHAGVAQAGQYGNVGSATGTPVDNNGNPIPGASNPTASNPDHYFGYSPVRIGDFVWNDLNGNGIQNAGEPGIVGVTLTLTGTDFLGNPVTDTTTTDATGHYLFTEAAPGTYTVAVATPAGYVPTATGQGSSSTDSNPSPSGTTPGTFPLPGGGSDLTVDFGFYRPVSIGDFVWQDANANGVQDAGEPGIGGVTLTLTGTTGAGVAIALQTTITNGSGFYQFSGLAPGTYTVAVTAPAGYVATATGQGTTATDSNPSPSPTSLASGGSDQSIDFGFYTKATLGDLVWEDLDADGVQDANEPGVDGATVKLLNVGGTVIATTTTDADGEYLFGNLTPGTYSIQFVAPSGFNFTLANQGSNDAIDSDANQSTGKTGAYTLVSGQTNLTVDAGLVGQLHGLTGTIGFWANKNGQALLRLLNGGATATALGNWLATNFPNLYGPGSKSSPNPNNFSGKTNDYVASRFVALFNVQGQKLPAQILATAFAMYVTTCQTNTTAAARDFAAQHGFKLSNDTDAANLRNVVWDLGSNGLAFTTGTKPTSVPTSLTVWQILQATDANAVNGVLWANSKKYSGVVYDSTNLGNMANVVFSGINQAGDILSWM